MAGMYEGKDYLTSKVPIGTPTTVTVNSTMAASAIHTSQVSNNISLTHAAHNTYGVRSTAIVLLEMQHILLTGFNCWRVVKMLELSLAFESLLHGALIGKQT